MMRKILWIIVIFLVLLFVVLADFLMPIVINHNLPDWYELHILFIILGVMGTLAIIFIAKWLVKYWLGRREDYYD